jgi:hypothetical protein
LSWRWTFIISGIFLAFFTVLLTLFVPETAYNRAAIYELDVNGDEGIDALNAKHAVAESETDGIDSEKINRSTTVTSYGPRKGIVARMALCNGRFSPESPIRLILRPWALLLHWPLFWTMIFTGMSQVFSVGISFLIPQVYGQTTKYDLNPAQLGYVGAGPVVGIIISSAFYALTFDRTVTWAARRNNGIYEVLSYLVLQTNIA